MNYTDKNGLKQGKWRWFYEDGTLQYSAHYKNNILHGLNTHFDIDGHVSEYCVYKNGKIDGKYIYVFPITGKTRGFILHLYLIKSEIHIFKIDGKIDISFMFKNKEVKKISYLIKILYKLKLWTNI